MRRWGTCHCVIKCLRFHADSHSELLAAYRVLCGSQTSQTPPADLKTLQTLYYIYAKRYHPDAGIEGCEVKMKRGNEAYALLKAATHSERQLAMKSVSHCEAAYTNPRVPPVFWMHQGLTIDEKEFNEFLQTLEGTDKLRFYRSWTSPDGTRYRGIEERKSFSSATASTDFRFDKRHFGSTGTIFDGSTRAVIALAIACTLLAYFVTLNMVTRRLIEKIP